MLRSSVERRPIAETSPKAPLEMWRHIPYSPIQSPIVVSPSSLRIFLIVKNALPEFGFLSLGVYMIVEQGTYTLRPGSLRQFLSLYEAEGLEVQRHALGNLLGYFVTEVGNLNQVTQLWGFCTTIV